MISMCARVARVGRVVPFNHRKTIYRPFISGLFMPIFSAKCTCVIPLSDNSFFSALADFEAREAFSSALGAGAAFFFFLLSSIMLCKNCVFSMVLSIQLQQARVNKKNT